MSIKKNFTVEHGLEVGENLLIAQIEDDAVGIGTTVPTQKLHVENGNVYVNDGVWINTKTIKQNRVIPEDVNAMSIGPTITIDDGKTVYVSEESFWTIVL